MLSSDNNASGRILSGPELAFAEADLAQIIPLELVFERWLQDGTRSGTEPLLEREQRLGASTLPAEGLRLIYEVAVTELASAVARGHVSGLFGRPLHQRIVRHPATHSAKQTQDVLPRGVIVQKSVSLAIGNRLMLCSCLGDHRLTHADYLHIGRTFSLSRKAIDHAATNPQTVDPVDVFGMADGMVSPFLPPHHAEKIAALVLAPWPITWEQEETDVAISLSLWESLLIPVCCIRSIVRKYAAKVYSSIPVIEL